MTRSRLTERIWLGVALALLVALVAAGLLAPDTLPTPDPSRAALSPLEAPPLGTDDRGISLVPRVLQGARIVTLPALLAAGIVMGLATVAGLARSADVGWFDIALTALSELLGALPRLVVILVVAVAMPRDARSLVPIAVAWAVLSAPGAMDEAASTAGRLGGARFVEALRAHGFSAARIYLYHIVWLNLRPVLVRQGAEVITQVVFLEISLSYLARTPPEQPSLTHPDSVYSWASLLYDGYSWLVYPSTHMGHALGVSLLLLIAVVAMAQGFRIAARGR